MFSTENIRKLEKKRQCTSSILVINCTGQQDIINKTHLLFHQTGLMVARAAALRTNINIDGRPLP